MIFPFDDVAVLVPHSAEMVLLDRVLAFSEEALLAEAKISDDHVFLREGKVPLLMAVEILAQAIAAWEGCRARLAGREIRLGFFLGSRQLVLHGEDLAVGSVVQAEVRRSFEDDLGFAVFDGRLFLKMDNARQLLIEGRLSVLSEREKMHG